MKAVLLGKEYGGKTSLVYRYLHERFSDSVPYQATIGAAFGAKRVEVAGKPVVMGIWDTAGSERYEAMSRIYYRGARAAIVCYDLTDKSSFDKTKFWVDELQKNEPGCRIYLCGTKKDLIGPGKGRREVDCHDVSDYANAIQATVFETSSKTGENIHEMFLKIAQDFLRDNELASGTRNENVLLPPAATPPASQCRPC